MTYAEAAAAFAAAGGSWAQAEFFTAGLAGSVARGIDRRAAAGAQVLPAPEQVFRALELTTLEGLRCVILGQDPYPTPGDANGLAFSYAGPPPLPRSLVNIHKELQADLGLAPPSHGRLDAWAENGVLLLNAVLTVEARKAGAHRGLGWETLTDGIIRLASRRAAPAVFILWGNDAQKKRGLIDEARHHVIASAHPSPLSARGGFFGSKPFSRASSFLQPHGQPPVNWSL